MARAMAVVTATVVMAKAAEGAVRKMVVSTATEVGGSGLDGPGVEGGAGAEGGMGVGPSLGSVEDLTVAFRDKLIAFSGASGGASGGASDGASCGASDVESGGASISSRRGVGGGAGDGGGTAGDRAPDELALFNGLLSREQVRRQGASHAPRNRSSPIATIFDTISTPLYSAPLRKVCNLPINPLSLCLHT